MTNTKTSRPRTTRTTAAIDIVRAGGVRDRPPMKQCGSRANDCRFFFARTEILSDARRVQKGETPEKNLS